MYELFRISNDVVPYILAVRSTKVFGGQLLTGAIIGALAAGIGYTIFFLFKKWKDKK